MTTSSRAPRTRGSKLKHALLHSLAALSAGACFLVVALWVCSFFTAGVLIWDEPGWTWVVHSQRNLMGMRLYQDDQGPDKGFSIHSYPNPGPPPNTGLWEELQSGGKWIVPHIGLGYRQGRTDKQYRWRLGNRPIHNVYAPHWLLVLAFGVLPGLWYSRVLRLRRRAKRGCCLRCGYDLRATPDRCPECGHARTARTLTHRAFDPAG